VGVEKGSRRRGESSRKGESPKQEVVAYGIAVKEEVVVVVKKGVVVN
jgi:hypothetical protein